MKRWSDRPIEQRRLLNPAFLSVIVTEAAVGYAVERDQSLPFALAFLTIPIVLHEPTREALPTIATSMYAWLEGRPQARVFVPPLARQFVPHTREAIRFGVDHGALKIVSGGSLTATDLKRPAPGSQTADVRRCRSKAQFSGRWLARAGDQGTVLAAWGLTV